MGIVIDRDMYPGKMWWYYRAIRKETRSKIVLFTSKINISILCNDLISSVVVNNSFNNGLNFRIICLTHVEQICLGNSELQETVFIKKMIITFYFFVIFMW